MSSSWFSSLLSILPPSLCTSSVQLLSVSSRSNSPCPPLVSLFALLLFPHFRSPVSLLTNTAHPDVFSSIFHCTRFDSILLFVFFPFNFPVCTSIFFALFSRLSINSFYFPIFYQTPILYADQFSLDTPRDLIASAKLVFVCNFLR